MTINLTGQKFGRLTALEICGKDPSRTFKWKCLCLCGNTKCISGSSLRSGKSTSCGCLAIQRAKEVHTTHGETVNRRPGRVYNSWRSMKSRCQDPNTKEFKNYGGRGIQVCKEWQSFQNFYKDMGPRPQGTSLDRIDNAGNYTPSNCRWATRAQQNSNSRRCHFVLHKGERLTVTELAIKLKIKRNTLFYRLKKGIPIEGKNKVSAKTEGAEGK